MIKNNKKESLSLEERVQLYQEYLKKEYLDHALFQASMIYAEVKEKGLQSKFAEKHPQVERALMASFRIWEDGCGNTRVDPVDDDCCSGPCFAGCGVLCLALCCGGGGYETIGNCGNGCCECCDECCCNDKCY